MSAIRTSALFLVGMLGLSAAAATGYADDSDSEGQKAVQDIIDSVAHSSIVWMQQPIDASANENFAKVFGDKKVLATFDTLGGFVVRMTPAEAYARQEEVEQQNPDAPKIDYIEPNALVYGFDAECEEINYPSTETKDLAVTRVNGPLSPSASAKVWIVDSGISDTVEFEVDVNRTDSRRCNDNGCNANPASADKVGHGSVIATIIAAKQNGVGYIGVAPGAKVVPVQIFTTRRAIASLPTVYQAVQYLLGAATAGDVVNLSLGYHWDPRPGRYPNKIEQTLMTLADMGVRVSVAAGNQEILNGSGYVQTVSPARAGSYRPSTGGGAIVTVSAAATSGSAGNWQDAFWPESVFGNGEKDPTPNTNIQLGPPDFAEPGVDIATVWPAKKQTDRRAAMCTGTSFAAAVMSGILVKGMPIASGQVTGDPSASTSAPWKNDPVGVCCKP